MEHSFMGVSFTADTKCQLIEENMQTLQTMVLSKVTSSPTRPFFLSFFFQHHTKPREK